jgi:hypothetical protein
MFRNLNGQFKLLNYQPFECAFYLYRVMNVSEREDAADCIMMSYCIPFTVGRLVKSDDKISHRRCRNSGDFTRFS